jgi:DNA recombination-dependent growth factor C
MGARSGSISYQLYHIEGAAPASTAAALERIQEFAFQPLTPDAEDDFSYGWCVFEDLLSTEFTADNTMRGEYLCLSMRLDQWRLPGALFKARVEKKGREVLERNGKTKLFRSEKEQIRETVSRELKTMTLPAASVTDLVWSVDGGVVRFWSQSARMLELFESLFESTFEVRLRPSNPYVEAVEAGLPDALVGALAVVEQASFSAFEG